MKNSKIDLIFRFTVKKGQEALYEETLQKQLAITAEKDPGVISYEIFKNDDGSYCQHEHYENEEAILIHMKNTERELEVWSQITEITQIFALGNLSEAYLKQYPEIVNFRTYRQVVR